MNKKNDNIISISGSNIFTTLQLIFLTLKAAGLVDWSWWFVFTPLFAELILILIVALLILFVIKIDDDEKEDKK